MKKRTPKQYAEALYEVTKSTSGNELESAVVAFVKLLARDRMLKKSDAIIEAFIKKDKMEKGIVDLEVITARKTDNDVLEKIKQVFGKQSVISEKVDETVMGGLIVKTEVEILDASVKTQLQLLKNNLM
jgi:F-type H+-transporting ATPase subunit delta